MQFNGSQVDLRATFTASQHGSVLHAPKFLRKTLVCAKEVNIYDRTCEGSLNVCTLIYPQRFATDVLKTHSMTVGSLLIGRFVTVAKESKRGVRGAWA
jgi:hypothetical protein